MAVPPRLTAEDLDRWVEAVRRDLHAALAEGREILLKSEADLAERSSGSWKERTPNGSRTFVARTGPHGDPWAGVKPRASKQEEPPPVRRAG